MRYKSLRTKVSRYLKTVKASGSGTADFVVKPQFESLRWMFSLIKSRDTISNLTTQSSQSQNNNNNNNNDDGGELNTSISSEISDTAVDTAPAAENNIEDGTAENEQNSQEVVVTK